MSNSFRSTRQAEENKPTRYYSSRQETAVAKAVNGRKQPNSGATMFQPGDVKSDNWLYECKTCTKDQSSFSLKEDWFTKNRQESLVLGKEYTAIVFSFGPNKQNYYIIDEPTFKEFLEYQKGNNI